MFEKERDAFLKAARPALPCAEARSAFARYVGEVAQDVLTNVPGADFAAVAAQLGPTPRQAAEDFVDSQPPETQARWSAAGRRQKRTVRLAVGLVIAVLAVIAVFFIATKGVLVVNTETTYMDWSDQEYTQEELDVLAEQALEQIAKEHENDENP